MSRFAPKNLFSAPVFQDVAKTRAARLAYTILYSILGIVVVVPAIAALVIPTEVDEILVLAVPMAFIVLGSLWLLHRGLVRLVGILLIVAFYLIITGSLLSYQGIRDLGSTGYFLVVAMAGLLLGGRGALFAGLACGLTALAVYLAEVDGLIVVTVEPVVTFSQLMALLVMLALVSLLLHSATRQGAESLEQATRSSAALGQAYDDVAASRDALQTRTEELQKHSAYLEASAEVGQAATSILEVQLLMERVVELIRQRFG
ncbi:MAG TPA: hypothetical protein VLC52_11855, partial [Anaerolineae bacterium]|nr:hypothetical protein [Anaerolineae bacterium]